MKVNYFFIYIENRQRYSQLNHQPEQEPEVSHVAAVST